MKTWQLTVFAALFAGAGLLAGCHHEHPAEHPTEGAEEHPTQKGEEKTGEEHPAGGGEHPAQETKKLQPLDKASLIKEYSAAIEGYLADMKGKTLPLENALGKKVSIAGEPTFLKIHKDRTAISQ